MSEPKRILITNDDGVSSPGIFVLARAVERAGYEVLVIAPDHDASGTGASLGRISPDHPIGFSETTFKGVSGRVYGLAGPPALCVAAGNLEAFGPRPDVVLSGVNAGLNTGRSALHSGTVGAALAAQNFGLRAMAVSLADGEEWHWKMAAELAIELLPAVLAGPERGALNLNAPSVPRSELRGVRWAALAEFGSVQSAISKVERDQLHFYHKPTGYEPEPDTDLAMVRAGFAAITALHGPSEVWGPRGTSGADFEADHAVFGATAGHVLRPSRAYTKRPDTTRS